MRRNHTIKTGAITTTSLTAIILAGNAYLGATNKECDRWTINKEEYWMMTPRGDTIICGNQEEAQATIIQDYDHEIMRTPDEREQKLYTNCLAHRSP